MEKGIKENEGEGDKNLFFISFIAKGERDSLDKLLCVQYERLGWFVRIGDIGASETLP